MVNLSWSLRGTEVMGRGLEEGTAKKKPRQVVGTVGFRWSCHGEGVGEDWEMKPEVG